MKDTESEQVFNATQERKIERKTTELCGHERDGARCMRERGHAELHESLFVRGEDVVRWD